MVALYQFLMPLGFLSILHGIYMTFMLFFVGAIIFVPLVLMVSWYSQVSGRLSREETLAFILTIIVYLHMTFGYIGVLAASV